MKSVIIIAIAFVLLIPVSSYVEMSEAEKQSREEIQNPCINISEPQVSSEWQGDIGMNNPEYMETVRDTQYQYNQQMQHCIQEYQQQIDQRVAELQCGDFEFGTYTPIEDYDLVYDLFSNGLNEKNLETSEILVQYKGTIPYEKECQDFYKEYKQFSKETERWNESCPDSGSNPNGKKYSYMIDIFNICGFASLEGVSVEESIPRNSISCGIGTMEKNGQCIPDTSQTLESEPSRKGGGCLIATATYGSELAPQVQQLRKLRDNKLLQTQSGTLFMNTFNDVYYSFSPYIADYERENPLFKEAVKVAITPVISSLSILNHVEMSSDQEVLGYGISLILLNVGMYVGVPVLVLMRFRK